MEAKKPSIPLDEDKKPAYQVRLYGYNKKLPISILTDFEEFAIYDTKVPPNENDTPKVARLYYKHYKDYIDDFDTIWSWCSRDAIADEDSNYNKAEKAKIKRGELPVDDYFLEFLSKQRDDLAHEIANRNKEEHFEERHFNYIVQKILDRLIFLRIAEDRGIEENEQLLKIAKEKNIYKSLCAVFERCEGKYNSSLFDKDERYLHTLQIKDAKLKNFIKGLYYPNPYEFSVMPVEILGHIYEQFLGDVIRVNPSGRVKVEKKPEVRKAGGVYYTPEYIVEYIVKNTVGEKVKDKSPDEVSEMSVLDPACGSGSFLIGAYDFLLNWHLDYYTRTKNEIKAAQKNGALREHIAKDKITGKTEQGYKLTVEEKKRILKNNIYGVDIDAQAIEVTKLSLLLKMLEDENEETSGTIFEKTGMTKLPDLSKKNIKCGNSLIGSDFYDDKEPELFPQEEMMKINAFDWEKEFPAIFKRGGFDCVIGNPPYGAELSPVERKFLESVHKLRNTDTAALFMSLSQNALLAKGGACSFIVPKPFVYSSNWKLTRELILDSLSELVDCGKVWKNVKLEQVIYCTVKGVSQNNYISSVRAQNEIHKVGEISKQAINDFGFYVNGVSSKELSIGYKLLKTGSVLNDFVENQRGGMLQKSVIETPSTYSVLGGKQISRYNFSQDIKGYLPSEKLSESKARILEDSVLVQNIVAHIMKPTPHIKVIATLPKLIKYENFVVLDTINQLKNKSKYAPEFITGIINSKLVSWYLYLFLFAKAIRTMHFDNAVTSRIPFPNLDLAEKKNQDKHDKLVNLVDQMLEAQKTLHEAKTKQDKDMAQKRVDMLDNRIDALVYELYGLSDEDIAVIEESVSQ